MSGIKTYLFLVLLLSTPPIFALEKLDPQYTDAKSFQESWKENRKQKFISDKEMKDLLKQKDFDVEFRSVYKPIKKGRSTYAEFQYAVVDVKVKREKDYGPEPEPKYYKFTSCKNVRNLFFENLNYSETSSGAYKVKHNNYFIVHKNEVYYDWFEENCENLYIKNTYTCPEYTQSSSSVGSLFGPILFVNSGHDGGGGCGPSYHSANYSAYRLGKKKEILSLDEMVELPEIAEALKTSAEYESHLRENHQELPKDMIAFLKSDSLKGFSLGSGKIEDGKVSMNLIIEEQECGMCPNQGNEITVQVKPKEWLAKELAEIKSSK